MSLLDCQIHRRLSGMPGLHSNVRDAMQHGPGQIGTEERGEYEQFLKDRCYLGVFWGYISTRKEINIGNFHI